MTGVPVSLHGGHTTVFDGAAGATEMVAAARAAGMEVYGLSEHFYRPREERFLYGEADRDRDWGRAGWPRFAEEVVALKAEGEGRRPAAEVGLDDFQATEPADAGRRRVGEGRTRVRR